MSQKSSVGKQTDEEKQADIKQRTAAPIKKGPTLTEEELKILKLREKAWKEFGDSKTMAEHRDDYFNIMDKSGLLTKADCRIGDLACRLIELRLFATFEYALAQHNYLKSKESSSMLKKVSSFFKPMPTAEMVLNGDLPHVIKQNFGALDEAINNMSWTINNPRKLECKGTNNLDRCIHLCIKNGATIKSQHIETIKDNQGCYGEALCNFVQGAFDEQQKKNPASVKKS